MWEIVWNCSIKQNIQLIDESKCELCLKVKGFKEYLKGNQQLLNYDRVRICLWKKKNVELILVDIPLFRDDKYFPPIFNIDPSKEFKDYFANVANSSPYFWHPPYYENQNLNKKVQEED